MHDIRRIAAIACFLLVTLRLFIGWQFFYEGMWKYQTIGTADEWTAEGYLKNAQGPFRDTFRDMTGDPDGLDWLDYNKVAAKWDRFADRMTAHYNLDEEQQKKLRGLVDGVGDVTAPLESLPEGVDWAGKSSREELRSISSSVGRELAKVTKWDGKTLRANTVTPVKPSEIRWAMGLVPFTRDANGQYIYTDADGNVIVNMDPEEIEAPADVVAYYLALERIEVLTQRGLGYKNKARASLLGDPNRIGVTAVLREKDKKYVPAMETTPADEESIQADSLNYGDIQIYKDLLGEYESYLEGSNAEIAFRQDHAAKIAIKVREKYNEVVVPIVNLDKDLRTDAMALLTAEQLAKGALPAEQTPLRVQSQRAMWGLLILGALLILGLLTRVAAVAGAVMLLSFYLVWPPWPGVPAAPGPEHSLVVNKNLIEVVALLAIAAMPTGTWFGVDGIFYRLFRGKKA